MSNDEFIGDTRSADMLARAVFRHAQDLAFSHGYTPRTGDELRRQLRGKSLHGSHTQDVHTECFDKTYSQEQIHSFCDTLGKETVRELQKSPGIASLGTSAYRSRRDPHKVAQLLDKLIGDAGWSTHLLHAQVADLWPQTVGEAIARNTEVESCENHVLVVRAASSGWAHTLRYEIPRIMKRCDEIMPVRIDKLIIKPPKAPSWKHGKYSVKGPGPRDTYG